MIKPRKQVFTTDMYLDKNKDKDIRNDAYVQRLYVWSKEQANELIYTVLTGDYIPPIIIGEEVNSQKWIIDGGQRTSTLLNFKYGNYKITSSIEESVIKYKAKKKDENGNIVVDGEGNIVWEDVEFDIKNKTYDLLPDELRKAFNEYQIETVIHEGCDMKRISKLIKRYNNHTGMNVPQKAFTYIENFAKDIRDILEHGFFKNCGSYREKEKQTGVMEKVVLETVMCISHLDEWKKTTKAIASYLNKNADKKEFDRLSDYLDRLENVLGEEFKDIFTSKNTFIWLALFDKFNKLGVEDEHFAMFLRKFKDELNAKEVNGVTFADLDEKKNTKDKSLIIEKLETLETLMNEFIDSQKEQITCDTVSLVQEVVDESCTEEDVEFYEEILNDITIEVNNESKLMESDNKPSLVAIVGHACDLDQDEFLNDWIVQYFRKENTYDKQQAKNYQKMRKDFDDFVRTKEAIF